MNRPSTSALVVGSLLLAGALTFSVSQVQAQWGPFAGSGQSGSGGVSYSPSAADDAYANTFVSTGFSADGGTGGFAFECSGPDCRYKLAEGTSSTLRVHDNTLDMSGFGLVALPTATFQALSCPAGSNCYINADTGKWVYLVPTAGTTGCAAGTAGGLKQNSSDNRAYNCDGTTAQRLAYSLSGSATLDYGSLNPNDTQTLTVGVAGATTADYVGCGPINVDGGVDFTSFDLHPWISASDTASVEMHNESGGVINPSPFDVKCVVTR